MIFIDHDKEPEYASTLQSLKAPIADRVNALFCLRTISSLTSIDELIKAFYEEPKSELLLHEICYCLGQMTKSPEHIKKIQTFLESVILGKYTNIVLHEAVEALGNLDNQNTLKLLEKLDKKEESEILFETCFLTIKLLEWNSQTDHGKTEGLDKNKIKFSTNDPAPPFNYFTQEEYRNIEFLQKILLNNKDYDLFDRYRALFTLRELNTEQAVVAICSTLIPENSKTCSALLKHEVAFVLAQMEEVFHASIPFLLQAVGNNAEDPIVRHEALVAVGEMIEDKSIIEQFLSHPDPIVSESCEVAISMINYRLQCKETQ